MCLWEAVFEPIRRRYPPGGQWRWSLIAKVTASRIISAAEYAMQFCPRPICCCFSGPIKLMCHPFPPCRWFLVLWRSVSLACKVFAQNKLRFVKSASLQGSRVSQSAKRSCMGLRWVLHGSRWVCQHPGNLPLRRLHSSQLLTLLPLAQKWHAVTCVHTHMVSYTLCIQFLYSQCHYYSAVIIVFTNTLNISISY